jgi:DNA internalization-related competence protein ComEC/Rec2
MIRKQINWLRLIILMLLICVLFYSIYKDKETSHIVGYVKVVDIESYEQYERITVRYHLKKYHIYSYQDIYTIGDQIYLDADIALYRHESIPFGFDFYDYFLSKGICGKLENIENISITQGFHVNKFRYTLLEKQDNAYVRTLLFGHAFKEENVESLYQNLDIVFLLNVSGLHIYMFIQMIKKIGYHLNLDVNHQKIFIFIVYLCILYLSNMDISVLRLVTIFLIFEYNQYFELRLNKIDQHILAFLMCLILNRYLLYSMSFLMMFTIVMMIQLTSYIYEKQHPIIKKYIISVIIVLCLSPLQNHFSISYLLLSPVYIALFCYILYPFSWIVLFIPKFNMIFDILMSKVNDVLYILEKYQFNITYHKLTPPLIILAYILILILLLSKSMKQIILRLVLCILIFSMPSINFYQVNQDLFYMIDVGQGDGFYIKIDDVHIVVDAFDQTTNFLENHGINHIDYLILTHSDEDHTKEAHNIIDSFRVSEVLISAYDDAYDQFDAHVRRIKAGDQIILENQTIRFFNPIYDYGDANNNSLVFKVKIGDYDVLMTGDIEETAENAMIETYGNQIQSDVLKIAHHGSDTSTTQDFLHMVSPKIALISVGTNNRFDFPSNQTINRLNEQHIKIYRSDIHGTVIYRYRFKKGKWVVYL